MAAADGDDDVDGAALAVSVLTGLAAAGVDAETLEKLRASMARRLAEGA